MQLNTQNEKPTPCVLAQKEGNKIHITLLYDEDSSHYIDLDYEAFRQLNSGAARLALRQAAMRLQDWETGRGHNPRSDWYATGTAGVNPNAFGAAMVNRDDLRPREDGHP
jgi:hypothetical protein